MHNRNERIQYYILIILFLFPAMFIQSSLAQESSNFLNYDNPTLQITMIYPLHWQKIEKHNGVTFVAPRDINSHICCQISVTVSNAPVSNVPSDIMLGLLADKTIEQLNKTRQHFQLVNFTPIFIGQTQLAQKIVYRFYEQGLGTLQAMDIGTIKGDKVYVIRYIADKVNYSTHLLVIDKMIESFRIYA